MNSDIPIKNLCTSFLFWLKWTRKYSPYTIKSYSIDLIQIFLLEKDWDILNPPDVSVKDVSKKDLEASIKKHIQTFLDRNRKLSASSQNRKLATIRSFIKWLYENNFLESDFRYFFKTPKVSSKIPNVLSVDEVLNIITTLQEAVLKKHKGAEDALALLYLLYGSGLRVSEACHLKNQDIDWVNKTLRIKGKGGKERLVTMPSKASKYLMRFHHQKLYLFGEKPLPQRKAYDMVRIWGERSGILKPIHPHVLRHSFATHLLTSGSHLRTLQEMLGHTTLTATQKYLHLNLNHLSKTLEKYHPINTTGTRVSKKVS